MAKSDDDISLAEEIELLANREPHVPFSIVMASGSRYDVNAFNIVAVGQSVIIITHPRAGYDLLRQSQISEVSVTGALQ